MIIAGIEVVDCKDAKLLSALQACDPVLLKLTLVIVILLNVIDPSVLDITNSDESDAVSNTLLSFNHVILEGGTANDEQFNCSDSPISNINDSMGFTVNCGTTIY